MLDAKNLGLNIKPNRDKNEPCNIICFSDNDYADDPDSRYYAYFRCACFLDIKSIEKHELIKFGSRVGGAMWSCERGYTHDSIADKH